MTQSKHTVATIYNPKNLSKEELIDRFVVRQKIFSKLYEELRNSKMIHPEQHILVEAKRGMGKTTLLLRLSYELENDPALNTWMIPLVFNEEEYSIRKLYKFWERVIELLDAFDPSFKVLKEEADKFSSSISSDDEYERSLYDLLSTHLKGAKKKIVLFIDNFGDMFRKFNEKEAHRLRKILQTSADIRIIAASSVVLEAFYEYNHPFYEFFKVERLEGLDKKATLELLIKLGEFYEHDKVQEIVKNQTGRVEAMRRLTGGVIRTIILLFEIFVDEQAGNAFLDLEGVLDRVTPLYKHRMDDLPAPQQEIVEAIALGWDAVSVKEISERTRMESKVVSANLSQLVKNEIIKKIKTNNKNNLYLVNERFFNIWFLMRHGRKGDISKVLWLVRFLEEWCDETEIIERAKKHMQSLKEGTYNKKAARFISYALAHSRHLPKDIQHKLMEETKSYLDQTPSTVSEVKEAKSDYNNPSDSIPNTVQVAIKHYKDQQYDQALEYFLKMEHSDDFRIAYCYHKGPKDYENAVKYYLKAIEKGSAGAMNNMALLNEIQFKDYKAAEKYYKMAVDNGNSYAMFNLALLYKTKLKDFRMAEITYLKAVEKGDPDAMYNLANLYAEKLENFDEAVHYYKMAITKGDLKAMSNIAYLYIDHYQNFEEGEFYFKMAIDHGLLYNRDYLEAYKENPLNFLFIFLMARGQFDYLYEYFTNERALKLQIKERLKPIYFALMYFMQDKHPNEYLRMGDEIKETVDDIINQIILYSNEVSDHPIQLV